MSCISGTDLGGVFSAISPRENSTALGVWYPRHASLSTWMDEVHFERSESNYPDSTIKREQSLFFLPHFCDCSVIPALSTPSRTTAVYRKDTFHRPHCSTEATGNKEEWNGTTRISQHADARARSDASLLLLVRQEFRLSCRL